MDQARAPHGLGLTPLFRKDGPQHLIQELAVLQERAAKHALLHRAQLAERAVAAAGGKIRFTFEWEPSNADVFVVEPGPFTDLVADAVAEVTERKPILSTTGGTSDARFIKNYCSVVEFGLVGQTMHQIDERVPTAELETLTAVYRRVIETVFERMKKA